jgi:hypothetical protein
MQVFPDRSVSGDRVQKNSISLSTYIKSLFLQTRTTSQKHSAQVHSALATLSITARQAMHGGHQQTRQRKQGILHNMFISGHAQASPEAASARPSKHAYRGTIQQEVLPIVTSCRRSDA